jgi:hypothetical protein
MKATLAFVLACMVFLVGCSGSPPASPVAQVSTAAPTSAPTATAVPATAAAQPTVASTSTLAAPTATAAPPTPTLAPPTPTLAPSPTTSATTASAASVASASSSCDNLYYPVKPGATWVYRSTTTGAAAGTTTSTETLSDITDTSFTRNYTNGKGTTAIHWTCSPSGLTAGDFNSGDTPSAPSTFHFQILQVSGTTVPPADQWKVGSAWQTAYQVTMQVAPTSGSSVPAMGGKGTITVAYKILSQDNVSVPAGSYPAWKVSYNLTENLAMTMNGKPLPVKPITVPGTTWFAQNVGLVKSQVTTPSGGETLELVSFKP